MLDSSPGSKLHIKYECVKYTCRMCTHINVKDVVFDRLMKYKYLLNEVINKFVKFSAIPYNKLIHTFV